jgi:hypothetical protein
MNDEQRSVTIIPAQSEELPLRSRPAALAIAYAGPQCCAIPALLDNKIVKAGLTRAV